MTHYKAKGNSIVNEKGTQIAVVLPVACTKKLAREMAAYAAQQANHAEQQKQRTRGVPGTFNDQGENRGR